MVKSDAAVREDATVQRVASWSDLAGACSAIVAGVVLVVHFASRGEIGLTAVLTGMAIGIGVHLASWCFSDDGTIDTVRRARDTWTPITLDRESAGDIAKAAFTACASCFAMAAAFDTVWSSALDEALVGAVVIGLGSAAEWTWVRWYERRHDAVAIVVSALADDDDETPKRTLLHRRDPVMAAFGR